MEMKFSKGKIVFDKELSDLDKFVIDFVDILNETGIRYVIVNGHVSILFGRSRATEDIDLFIEPLSRTKFEEFMARIEEKDMWTLNSSEKEELSSMLSAGLAIRIAERGKAISNFEIKSPKKDTDFLSLNNPIKVVIKGNEILVSQSRYN